MTSTGVSLRANTLDLPNPARLTEDQLCGRGCCWCAVRLTTLTAVDLGERREPVHWFPRCCPACIQATSRTHVSMCETCVEKPGDCETAAALRQLVREHTR